MVKSYYLGNFCIQLDADYANLTSYVLAHHHKQLEDLRENTRNICVVGIR
jgi:hypothetical protein